jgi:hypothetical protein
MKRRLVLVAATVICGCSGNGGGTEPPALPTRLSVSAFPSEAQTMIPITPQPAVQATDDQGRPSRAAVTVTAEVVSGNATIAAGATAATNANGLAVFTGLTLGALGGEVGPVSLRFSAPGLNAAVTTVTLRCAIVPIQIGQNVNRSLSTGDCSFTDGSFVNVFEMTNGPPVTAVRLTQDGTFRSWLAFRGPNEPRFYWGHYAGTASNEVSYLALLPSGRTRVVATSFSAGTTGNYTLRVLQASEDVGCVTAYVASPVTTTQRLADGDCAGGGFLADFFYVGLPRSATITASMATQAFGPTLTLAEDATDLQVASGSGQGTAGLVFTNTSAHDQVYYLRAMSAAPGGVGAYTLSVSVAYPAVSNPAFAIAGAARVQSEARTLASSQEVAMPRRPRR